MVTRIKQNIRMLVSMASLAFAGSIHGMDVLQDNSVMELKEALRQDKQKRKQERAENRTIIKLDEKKRFLSSTGVLNLGNPEEIRKKKIFGIIAHLYGVRFCDQLKEAFKLAIRDSSMIKILNVNDRFFDYVCKVYYIPGQQKTRWMLELSRSLRIKRAEDASVLK